ncbi:endonuclease [Phaeodactylibacter luteus]|uniref:Endonuclease I n=1 Tax=Phaeodactylibacter luteus TaxID=1564516 RepID=A0A5C6RZU0_9BACT|nr:endonuclease [Phaeodactylibacter luteus]TXB67644.1 hypothetical protein FRY97_04440 [Phaeodactylibacter luteus]
MLNKLVFLLAGIFVLSSAFGQLHQPILPGLEGDALLQALQDNFRPSSVLTYGEARDLLFGEIDPSNDTLYCVYTGLAAYIAPGEDPTETAFDQGINTEHTWPRSKGASGFIPEADMHHLFPTEAQANSDRGSFPFGEVPDAQAIRWYGNGSEFSSQPADDNGQYSELGNQLFEPPHAHKGDVARAMFYFYTVYREEALAADPSFFEAQRTTLCLWQAEDPVTQKEWDRTHAIAPHQQGKANPFVLDCTLATRCYCDDVVPPCTPPVSVEEVAPGKLSKVLLFPNPAYGATTLELALPEAGALTLQWHNTLGQPVLGPQEQGLPKGPSAWEVEAPKQAGIYIGQLRLSGAGRAWTGTVRLLVE